MELRTYTINTDQLYAVNLKLHVTELLALHYDSKELLSTELINQIKKATQDIAETLKERKMNV